jgi:tRNA 2-thiouridine synthesizing protein A
MEAPLPGSSAREDGDEETLDLRGLKCPMPALLARRHLAALPLGATVAVIADDPMAAIDIPHMCRNEGFAVLEVRRDGDVARFVLKRP